VHGHVVCQHDRAGRIVEAQILEAIRGRAPNAGSSLFQAVNDGRPAIPEELRRRVLIEAGHRCAIPTCKHPTTEIAHIVPWEQVKEHRFENLIALCPTDHTRYDKREIDRKAMLQYQANLSILNGRYTDFEQRVLRWFGEDPSRETVWLPSPPLWGFLYSFLVEDGFLEPTEDVSQLQPGFRPTNMLGLDYRLTPVGREFVNKWITGNAIDSTGE
jgi:HNH endonuclease